MEIPASDSFDRDSPFLIVSNRHSSKCSISRGRASEKAKESTELNRTLPSFLVAPLAVRPVGRREVFIPPLRGASRSNTAIYCIRQGRCSTVARGTGLPLFIPTFQNTGEFLSALQGRLAQVCLSPSPLSRIQNSSHKQQSYICLVSYSADHTFHQGKFDIDLTQSRGRKFTTFR